MAAPKISCPSAKSVYFESVKATLAQVRRDTAKVVRSVIDGGEKLTLTEHGQPCAEIVPLRKIDRRAACQDLMAIGPVEFLRGKALRIGERDRLGRRSRRPAGGFVRGCFRPEAENGGRDTRAPEGLHHPV
jgi:prevent-host-death family protein